MFKVCGISNDDIIREVSSEAVRVLSRLLLLVHLVVGCV